MPSGSNEYWQLGQSGNPAGRPPGSRNKRTAEIIAEIRKLGHKDCLMRLSEIVHSGPDTSLAIAASSALAPYMHSKMQSTPAPRFMEQTITVPNFTSIEEAETFLASLPMLLGSGQIDSQSALELSTLIKNWISAKFDHEELQMKLAAHGGYAEQRITINGGLPPLPGTNITMPVLNGADIDGHALPPPSAPQKD